MTLEAKRIPSRIAAAARNSRFCIAAMAVPFLLFSTVLVTARISGASMSPSLQDGDLVLCARHASLEYGDVVLFDHGDRVLVKRVEGLPGDAVAIRDGVLYRNGDPVDEPYLGPGADAGDDFESVSVPDGAVFVLGDNRYASMDSRSDQVGCVDSGLVIGKMLCRLGAVP